MQDNITCVTSSQRLNFLASQRSTVCIDSLDGVLIDQAEGLNGVLIKVMLTQDGVDFYRGGKITTSLSFKKGLNCLNGGNKTFGVTEKGKVNSNLLRVLHMACTPVDQVYLRGLMDNFQVRSLLWDCFSMLVFSFNIIEGLPSAFSENIREEEETMSRASSVHVLVSKSEIPRFFRNFTVHQRKVELEEK